MKNFNSGNIKEMRSDIVLLKKEGLTIKEITDELLPYCNDITEPEVLLPKVKAQWDAYVKLQNKAITDETEDELENSCFDSKNAERHEVVLNADGTKNSVLKTKEENIKGKIEEYTPEKLLELHGFIPTENWRLISAKMSKWEAQAPGGEIVQMVASKISAASVEDEKIDDYYSRVFTAANTVYSKKNNKIVQISANDGAEIAILPLADFHLDKREANNSCMSFEKQKQRFYAIIDWYKANIMANKNIGKAVFFWSQDFFNYDYLTEETTSRRNKQDSQAGYNSMVQEGNLMLIQAINELSEIVPVDIFYTRSNHDQHTAFNAMCSLYAAFKNNGRVIIDGLTAEERNAVWQRVVESQKNGVPVSFDALFDSSSRSYLMWGECLFGFGHGDKEGQRIFNLMQTEANNQFCRSYAKKNGIQFNGNPNELPDFEEKFAWDKTFVHVYFCGHFHSKQRISKDEAGVEVIYCGTEMTGDAWHEECGYIGAQRRVEMYTYTKDGNAKIDSIQSRNLKYRWDNRAA